MSHQHLKQIKKPITFQNPQSFFSKWHQSSSLFFLSFCKELLVSPLHQSYFILFYFYTQTHTYIYRIIEFRFITCVGEIICEELPVGQCSFSIASSGRRCLLETSTSSDGKMVLQCQTSQVMVKNMANLVEREECVSACRVDRKSVGISSDSLLEPQFTASICSPACYQNCPNIIDLYYNLAIGEGDNL